jgi:hypothetical protein
LIGDGVRPKALIKSVDNPYWSPASAGGFFILMEKIGSLHHFSEILEQVSDILQNASSLSAENSHNWLERDIKEIQHKLSNRSFQKARQGRKATIHEHSGRLRRRKPAEHDGQNPRRRQENANRYSFLHCPQRTRAKPFFNTPQSMNFPTVERITDRHLP